MKGSGKAAEGDRAAVKAKEPAGSHTRAWRAFVTITSAA